MAKEATNYLWLFDAGVDQYYYGIFQLVPMDRLCQGFDMLMACRHAPRPWLVVRLSQEFGVGGFARM